MPTQAEVTPARRNRALAVSTIAFTVCFAVWTIFAIIGIQIKQDLGLNETEFGLLVATPVLTGSLSRIFLGIWADQYGGRIVNFFLMIATSAAVWLLSLATSYPMFLLAGLGVGFAGGSFAVGIAYVSRWYEKEKQGTALGIFGMGNVGAALTNFGAPFLLLAFGWKGVAQIYALGLLLMALVFWLTTEVDPLTKARRASGKKPESVLRQLAPLKNLQVWRFATYYFFVFGGFVALALWLPRYYVGAYGVDIQTAGMLAAAYALPGSVFRAAGGWLADKWGARRVMYWTFVACLVCTFLLSYPETGYIVQGIDGPIRFTIAMDLAPFVALTVILGFFMSLGKAAVYKHIPVYYPDNVGSVGGMVGMIGGLGGFILPICFGVMNDLAKVWTSCFMLLFVIVAISLIWMHFSIIAMERRLHPDLGQLRDFPELATLFSNKQEEQIVFAPGEYLIREGEKSNAVYFVTEGEVAILKDGVEIDRQKSRGIVGELGVLATQPRPVSVKCLTEVKALCVNAQDFLETIDQDPQSLLMVNRILVDKIMSSHTAHVRQTNGGTCE